MRRVQRKSMSIQPRENFDMKSRIASRYLLRAVAALIAVAAWACGSDLETFFVKETVVVEVDKQVQVEDEKEVQVTVEVEVEKVVEVEKEVIVEVMVEKEEVAPTATPEPAMMELPDTESPAGTLVMIPEGVAPGVGINRSQAPESLMYWGVSEQLFRPNDDGTLVGPWLAESWEVSPDGSQATVTLRSGVQFHGGWGELTAHDFVWSLNDTNAVTTPESIHGQAGDFAAFMDEAEATDDRTVVLNFNAPEPRWTTLLFNQAGDAFGVFSKKAYDEMGADWMRENVIGTGPYMVEEWRQSDSATLIAQDTHWDKTAEVATLRLIDVPETVARISALRSGGADWAVLPVREIGPLTRDGFKSVTTGRQSGVPLQMAGNYWESTQVKTGEPTAPVTFVHDIPWIGNPFKPNDGNNPDGIDDMEQARLVRWAIAMSIDRDLVNESLYGNNANPYYVGMFHIIDTDWDDKWKIPYDPAMANEYLDKAGYPRDEDGKRFDMPIYGFTSRIEFTEIADAAAGFINQLGIETSVIKIAYSIIRPSLVGRTNTTPSIQWCRSDLWKPYDWVTGEEETSLTRGGFGCHIEIPFILDTVQKVAAETDPAKRKEYNVALADYLWEQQLKIGIVALPFVSAYNPNAIEDWPMRPGPQAPYTSPELIVPAR
ncbi:MAG: ABC transporter substrate-binding protein [Chloroflexi bacterium]|nr:ABC transporter substrate-binding protein [Chloroflexota bacterium]